MWYSVIDISDIARISIITFIVWIIYIDLLILHFWMNFWKLFLCTFCMYDLIGIKDCVYTNMKHILRGGYMVQRSESKRSYGDGDIYTYGKVVELILTFIFYSSGSILIGIFRSRWNLLKAQPANIIISPRISCSSYSSDALTFEMRDMPPYESQGNRHFTSPRGCFLYAACHFPLVRCMLRTAGPRIAGNHIYGLETGRRLWN